MTIVQEEEGRGVCHFTRQGLGLLLYLTSVIAEFPYSVQRLALTHIYILARGPGCRLLCCDVTERQNNFTFLVLVDKTIRLFFSFRIGYIL